MLRRVIVIATVAASLLVFVPPASAVDRVFCRVTTPHRVTCYNNTPYRVFINLTVRTSVGPRYYSFWHRHTRWTKYFFPVVNSVRWNWHF
jgi:hypothetical protein